MIESNRGKNMNIRRNEWWKELDELRELDEILCFNSHKNSFFSFVQKK